jgi:outer membrane immunogenic protein
MKKFGGYLLATAGGVAVASSAQAADMPVKAPPLQAAPMASWEGWYVGLHAGGNWQQSSLDNSYYSSIGIGQPGSTGFIGGGQIGYNWQRGTWVYGLEADFSGLTGSGSRTNSDGSYTSTSQVSWLSTFRGRLGTTLGGSGDAMIYATGGLAVGGVKNTLVMFGDAKSVSKTKVGWTAGAGFEKMLDRHWSFGAEGLYVDLGTNSITARATEKSTSFKTSLIIARLKLNYRW